MRGLQHAAAWTLESAAWSLIALLRRLNDAVTAERPELAPDVAFAVTAVIDAVVAFLAEAEDAVAAYGAAVAGRCFEA